MSNDNIEFRNKRDRKAEHLSAVWAQMHGGEPDAFLDEAKQRLAQDGQPYRDDDLLRDGYVNAAIYKYTNIRGNLLFEVLRYEHADIPGFKIFKQRRLNGDREWVNDAGRVKVPYGWPELDSRPDETVYFTEGEKDADRLRDEGLLATTIAGQNWSMTAAKALEGRDVVLLFDNDKSGLGHEAEAVKNLEGFASCVRVLRLPGLSRGGDVSDWLDAGNTVNDLLALAANVRAVGEGISYCKWEDLDPSTIPPRRWLYKPHYIRDFLSLVISTGGTGKSSLVMVETLSMVSGMALLGVIPEKKLRVWYWNGEDPMDELKRRFSAAKQHYGLTEADIGDRLFLDSGHDMPIVLATERHREVEVQEFAIQRLIAKIKERQIDVVIVDPFITTHQVPENDNSGIDRVAKACARIAKEANCAFMIVHHTVKPRGEELTVEHGRGASALLAAARTARVINTMSKAEADKAKIPEAQRRSHFRADVGKANLMKPAEDASWFKIVEVTINNNEPLFGDDVGVVTQWDFPTFDLKPNGHEVTRCLKRIKGGGPWRADPQSKKPPWVGVPIAQEFGRDLDDPADKAAVKKLVKAWLAEGYLVEVERPDDKRIMRPFIEVNEVASLGEGEAPESGEA